MLDSIDADPTGAGGWDADYIRRLEIVPAGGLD